MCNRKIGSRILLGLAVTLLWGVGSAQAQFTIGACPFVAGTPGNYVLTGSLVCAGVPPAITVTASGVHIDLAGFTISGPDGPFPPGIGILKAAGVTDMHVNGGTIKGFGTAISLSGGTDNHVNGMTIGPGNRDGVLFSASSDNHINGNTVSGNLGVGFLLFSSHRNRFNTNVCDKNISAPFTCGCALLFSSDGNSFTSNTLDKNGDFGIELISSSSNTIRSNTVTGTFFFVPMPGILVSGGSGNTIQGNTSSGNSLGVALFGSTVNTVQSNTALGNTFFDLFDSSPVCDANVWKSNTFGTKNVACIS